MKVTFSAFLHRISELPLVARADARLARIPLLSKLPMPAAWLSALVLLLVAAGGFAYFGRSSQAVQASDEAAMQTAVVRQGDMVIYASGTGTLISADEADMAFATGGEVTDLIVEVGDRVRSGDLLATVDDTDVRIAYAQAERALRELISPSAIAAAQTAIADAQSDLASSKSHRDYVLGPNIVYWEEEVAKAEEALDQAEAAADKAPSDREAQAALQNAKDYLDYVNDKLAGAWISYEEIYVPNHFTVSPRDGERYVAAPSEADILSARADVASAEAALQEAKWLYASLTGEDIPADATGTSLTEIEKARLDLQAAQADLDGTSLYAPFDGTIMSIDTNVGDTAATGTAVMTMADLSQPYLEVYLDESDWSNVELGYEVEVTFDILPDKTYTGAVTQVDPGLYTENGTSVVRALVKLDTADADSFNLPLGTTASVDVIGGRAENAVLVPVEALHHAGDQYTVFVVEDGKLKLRVVEVGLQDLLYAEITSGLEPGEIVTTGITETQ
ncbi:MAG TPA: efflux RND transporter periplasmic adaptor subunit [Anaerolineales bacterium]